MGYSRWDDKAYTTMCSTLADKVRSARAYGASVDDSRREYLFTQKGMKPEFNPAQVQVRESCDSELNPNSTPIILGVDVTGSMGFIAEKIAIEGLGKLVSGIINQQPIPDPHIMIMGIGDAYSDSAPLQTTQFESDIRIAEQLKDIWLEGRGGGNGFESYDLPWYFAATKTKIDSFDKRGKKGYIFTIGDELPPPFETEMDVNRLSRIMGNAERGVSPREMLTLAEQRYQVFHVIAEEGSFANSRKNDVRKAWANILGKRAIFLRDHNYISEVILSVIRIAEGADPESVIASWEDSKIANEVKYALGM